MLNDFLGGLIHQVLHRPRLVLLVVEVAPDYIVDSVLDTRLDVTEWAHILILQVLGGLLRGCLVLCFDHNGDGDG